MSAKIISIYGLDYPSLSANSSDTKVLATQVKKKVKKFYTTEWGQFKEPGIYPKVFDLNKKWYVYIEFRREGEKWHRKKYVQELNRQSKKDKIGYARDLQKAVFEKFKEGYNPFTGSESTYSEANNKTVFEALDWIVTEVSNALAKKTRSSYKSSLKVFHRYLKEKSKDTKLIDQFNRQDAFAYSDFLVKYYSNRTHNNHISYVRIFFNYLIDREILKENPFSKVKKKKEETGRYTPFTHAEINLLRKQNKNFVLFFDFCLETLLRTNELNNLQKKDFDFINKIVIVQNNPRKGKEVKDNFTRRINISNELAERLNIMLRRAEPEDKVFSYGFRHSKKNTGRNSDISKQFTEVLRKLNFSEDYTLYSVRHVGAIIKWQNGIKPFELMNIMGHSGWDSTSKYLKGLGIVV